MNEYDEDTLKRARYELMIAEDGYSAAHDVAKLARRSAEDATDNEEGWRERLDRAKARVERLESREPCSA